MVLLFYFMIYLLAGLFIHLVMFRYDMLDYRRYASGVDGKIMMILSWPAILLVLSMYGVGAIISKLERAVLPSEKPSEASKTSDEG